MKTIFVVDDNTANLIKAEEALSDQYNVITLVSAAIMFELLDVVIPDLILLDIMMPEIDGFKALRMLREIDRFDEIPVMFLTSRRDPATEAMGFEMGVVDFITKPFSEPVLRNRIKAHLFVEDKIQERTTMLKMRTEKLLRLQNSLVSVLANMVESRDKLTGKHITRTTEYIKILLDSILEKGLYADEIKDWNLNTVISSARLHDVGKIVISDLILNKPGRFTDEEYEIMKSHATEGERMIDSIIEESGEEDFLINAKLFAGSHHEWWDGSGYPRGLKGGDIPLQGRIMAIVDVYDALVSKRPYKKAFTHEEAVDIIRRDSGKQFDPALVEVFLEYAKEYTKVEIE